MSYSKITHDFAVLVTTQQNGAPRPAPVTPLHVYPSLEEVSPHPRTSTGGDSQWSCSQCTLYNKKDSPVCVVCGHPQVSDGQRPARKSLERLPSVEQPWSCSSCTFFNPVSGNVCLMCQTPKKYTKEVGSKDTYETADVEELRRFHEEEALAQWEGIVAFCQRV